MAGYDRGRFRVFKRDFGDKVQVDIVDLEGRGVEAWHLKQGGKIARDTVDKQLVASGWFDSEDVWDITEKRGV